MTLSGKPSPGKVKKTVTFGGLKKKDTKVDDGAPIIDSINVVENLPETFDQQSGTWCNTPRPLDLLSTFVGKGIKGFGMTSSD